MALATLTDVKAAISSWTARTDFSDSQLEDFVVLAEGEIRNDVRALTQSSVATGTMIADGFSAPSDYLSTRTLLVDDTFVHYVTPETYALKSEAGETDGFYTINGTDFSVLGGTGNTYELLYTAKYPSLTVTPYSNWLLENSPQIYLWGCLKQASIYLMAADKVSQFDALYASEVRKLNDKESVAKYAGPLYVRSDSTSP